MNRLNTVEDVSCWRYLFYCLSLGQGVATAVNAPEN